MDTVLITGGTGMVGTQLTQILLAQGYKVIILSRSQKQSNIANLQYKIWNVSKQYIDPTAITQADHIVHLAGAGVADKRWSQERKSEIVSSRVESGKLLVHALANNTNQVKTVVSASAQGWYGADAGVVFTENKPYHNDFLGNTCMLWEQAITPVAALNKRLVILRIGIVLSTKGGALKEFLKPLLFRLATTLGNGKQIVSWVHLTDLCHMFLHAIKNQNTTGIYNACASLPVSNNNLITTIAKVSCGKFYIPFKVPAFLLKIIMGQMSIEVLKSTTMSNAKLLASGFKFEFNNLENGLKDLIENKH